MGWLALLTLAVALALDAFAVATVTSLTLNDITRRHVFRLSFHFGLFQALMLLLGWLGGAALSALLGSSHRWLAFGLLAIVGARMVWHALHGEPEPVAPDRTRGWDLVLLSIATSVDALAVGLSLGLVDVGIAVPALVIGLVAAALTCAGMHVGRRIGALSGRYVEVLGGLALIAIGLRIVWSGVVG